MNDTVAAGTLVFPASPGQERLWFLDQLDPAASTAYTLAVSIEVRAVVDPLVLQAAVNFVIERHEALRTSFRSGPDGLTQVVMPGTTATVALRDLRHLPPDERTPAARRLIEQEGRRPWNLGEAPLLRTGLFLIGPGRALVGFCVHHAVCDGISLDRVLGEILQTYASLKAGRQPLLAPPALQFADYVVNAYGAEGEAGQAWARRRAVDARFWRQRLRGVPLILDIPVDRQRPSQQSFRGARVPIALDEADAARLRDYTVRHGVSRFAVLLAAYATVLHHVTAAEDFLIGIPTANRAAPELAGTVGYLANVLPIRVDLRDAPDLGILTRRLHDTMAEALEHGSLPFGELVELLAPPRLLDRSPVCQVMFGLQQDVGRRYRLPGLEAFIEDVDTGAARMDLTMFLFESADGQVDGFLEYATALLEPETARNLALWFRTALDSLLRTPQRPVSSVAALSAIPAARGAAAEVVPATGDVWTTIRKVAASQGAALALSDDTGELTYGELVLRVETAAAVLRQRGCRPGERVAVVLDRGVDAVIALLACLAGGVVYLPVDPAAPAERLRLMARAGVKLAVVEDDAPDDLDVPMLRRAELAGPTEIGTATPQSVELEAPAYVMFTSGSTGRPKGVVVSHSNLALFLASTTARLGFQRRDRMLALTTFSFDISLLEVLGPLVCGGSVMVAPTAAQRDGAELVARLGAGVTVAQATPTTWRVACDAGLRTTAGVKLLCGGEPLPADLADRLLAGGAEVWNLYGPTETTIWSSAARVRPGEAVHLGEAFAGTSLRVVDAYLAPVPAGLCGELLVGGEGVALGYLDEPGLTAQRFLPDDEQPGGRLYRTGDLVRLRADGTAVYVGRRDDQVKVRGQRVELGELEAVLRSLDGIADAAAVVNGTGPAAALAAYLLPGAGTVLDPAWTERAHAVLRENLPGGLVPGELYAVEAIPMTPNGKTDRRALTGSGTRLHAPQARIAPRSAVERQIAALWTDLLGHTEVGITDDFFLLGGHSLLAAELIGRIERRLGVRLPVSALFHRPTVEGLALAVERGTNGSDLAAVRGDTVPAAGHTEPGAADLWDFDGIGVGPAAD